MRPSSLYSIQPVDPYRIRRKSSTKDESPTTPESTTQLIYNSEPGRAYSYLPYSNHLPDFKQSKTELYVEEDTDTLASHHQIVDMVNGENRTNTLIIPEDIHPQQLRRTSADQRNELSLTDKLRYKRQKKQEQTHFYTASSKRLFIAFIVSLSLLFIALTIYFCWPRVPRIVLRSEKLERLGDPADWGPTQQPWLRAAWKFNLTMDNTANYVTTHISNVQLTLTDRDTHAPFAWSDTGPIQLNPYKETVHSVKFRVDYESQSINDTTFKNLYNACGPQDPTESPALNLTMQAVVQIKGLAWSTTLFIEPSLGEGIYCPFN